MPQLARELAALAQRHAIDVVSLTLTCRPAHTHAAARALVLSKMRVFVAQFALRQRHVRGSGALLVLDESASDHVHVHALVAVRAGLEIEKCVTWWRRLWPASRRADTHERPARDAQRARLADTRREVELRAFLRHHVFNNMRKGASDPGTRVPLPPLEHRALGCGVVWTAFVRIMAARSASAAWSAMLPGLPAEPADGKPVVRRKPSTETDCPWCGKPFGPSVTRADARWCGRSCTSAASRALGAMRRRLHLDLQDDFVRVVAELEAHNWRRLDALRVGRRLVEHIDARRQRGRPVVVDWRGIERMLASTDANKALRCPCGGPLPPRVDAAWCGGACRMRFTRASTRAARARRVRAQRVRVTRHHQRSR